MTDGVATMGKLNPSVEPSESSWNNLDATAVRRAVGLGRWRNSQLERSRALWWLSMVSLLCSFRVSAEGPGELLVRERQVKTIARALAYDENLPGRAGGTVVLAVLYKPGNAVSEKEATESFTLFAKLESYSILGLPFHSVKLPITGVQSLEEAVRGLGIVALYVCPGVDDQIDNIKRVSRKLKVRTIASRQDQVLAGLALGVFFTDGRLVVEVNLPASREEGARFGSDLLRLAKVIQ